MPYPILFMATASATSSSNTITAAVVALASIGAAVGGYTWYSLSTTEERDNKDVLEEARLARYERDRYIREHANNTARLVSSETPPLIAAIQDNQRQFSELLTELTRTINQGEQGNAAIQNLIPLMTNQLNQLTTLTSQFESELPNSQQKLANLTTQLSAASTEFNQNQDNLSQALHDIRQVSSQLKRAADLVQDRGPTDATYEVAQLKQQTQDYKTYIEKLTQRVEEQSKIIKALEAKLVEKSASQNRHKTDPRVFKRPYKGIVPLESNASSYPVLVR